MGHINFDKGTRKTKNLKGFYLALAVCLVAVGTIGVATFVSTSSLEQDDTSDSTTSQTEATTPSQEEPVNQIVTNIPDDRTTADKTTTTTTTTSEADIETGATAAELFVLPLTNEVIKEFSEGQPVYSNTMEDWRVHNGVDFAGETNQSVKSIADGTILSISEDPLWGDVITIDHGYNVISRYCGVKIDSFAVGDSVQVGDVIGVLSEIPCESAQGAHLHLEVLVNNEYVNPVEAIGVDVRITAATE
jgi:murein DD-endopeptidase MepM/ murein hydrolase activator NlpD